VLCVQVLSGCACVRVYHTIACSWGVHSCPLVHSRPERQPPTKFSIKIKSHQHDEESRLKVLKLYNMVGISLLLLLLCGALLFFCSSAWLQVPQYHQRGKPKALRSTRAMPRLFASHATLSADHLSRESLEELKIEELKELLRSGNQKVTGNKAELVDRILLHNRGTSESRYDHSLSRLPKPVLESFLRFRSSSAAKSITLSSPQEPPKLLPIQQRSFDIIAGGGDAVLFSATGTGKTLAYILPLAKRLWEWKRDGSLQHKRTLQKKRFIQQQRNKNDSLASKQFEAAAPSVLVIEPSRELAKQVGKVWSKFHPTVTRPTKQIVTVFGGVPTARQAALLSSLG
jgi:hypothetical protein